MAEGIEKTPACQQEPYKKELTANSDISLYNNEEELKRIVDAIIPTWQALVEDNPSLKEALYELLRLLEKPVKKYYLLPEDKPTELTATLIVLLLSGRYDYEELKDEIKMRYPKAKVEYYYEEGKIYLEINFKNSDKYKLIINDAKLFKKATATKLIKTLDFILIKANEQNFNPIIRFSLTNYMKAFGLESKESAYRLLKRDMKILSQIRFTQFSEQRRKAMIENIDIIHKGKITFNICEVEISNDLKLLCRFLTPLPAWSLKLSPKAYLLIREISISARLNTDKLLKEEMFNMSLWKVNSYIANHTPEETEHHKQLIIEPILKAVKEINDYPENNGMVNLAIKCNEDYRNAEEFLNGYLEVKLSPELIEELTNKRMLSKENAR